VTKSSAAKRTEPQPDEATEYERFEAATRFLVNVPKKKIDEARALERKRAPERAGQTD
jgi:hypothetical protein